MDNSGSGLVTVLDALGSNMFYSNHFYTAACHVYDIVLTVYRFIDL